MAKKVKVESKYGTYYVTLANSAPSCAASVIVLDGLGNPVSNTEVYVHVLRLFAYDTLQEARNG